MCMSIDPHYRTWAHNPCENRSSDRSRKDQETPDPEQGYAVAVPIPDTTQLNATLVFKNMCDMYMYISNNELDQINYCDMKENKIK